MMPDYLLRLACREFPTYEHALAESPDKREIIVWEEFNSELHITYRLKLDPTQVQKIDSDHRSMEIVRLPSGFWAWIPNHPDDLAVVAEHKSATNKDFGATQIIHLDYAGSPYEMKHEDFFEWVEKTVNHQLGNELLNRLQEGKIYRTAKIIRKGTSKHFGGLVPKVSYAIMYAEEM